MYECKVNRIHFDEKFYYQDDNNAKISALKDEKLASFYSAESYSLAVYNFVFYKIALQWRFQRQINVPAQFHEKGLTDLFISVSYSDLRK